MYFSTVTLLASVLATLSQAAPAATCNTTAYQVPNGGFDGPANLAPWNVTGSSGGSPPYSATRAKQDSTGSNYVFKCSPAVLTDNSIASSFVDLYQEFPVCANQNYKLSWDWANSKNISGGLRVYAVADPQGKCPDNCVFTQVFEQRVFGPGLYHSNVTVNIPANGNSATSKFALMYEFFTAPPYLKKQTYDLNNVRIVVPK